MSEAAYRARSSVSAITTAMYWPKKWTRSSCSMRSLAGLWLPVLRGLWAGGGLILGALRCVNTASTPGAFSAARASMSAMRPFVIVDGTSTAWTTPLGEYSAA